MPKSKKTNREGPLHGGSEPTVRPSQIQGVNSGSKKRDERLIAKTNKPMSLVQFFRQLPLVGVDLDLERDGDKG
jgi:hypothetical protein